MLGNQLSTPPLPTEITVCGRTYETLGFLQGDEERVVGNVMVSRAKEMDAHLGQDDGEHILDYRGDIPVALRGKCAFVFTDWRHPNGSEYVAFLDWIGDCWAHYWYWLGDGWGGRYRVLRRKSAA